MKNFYGNNQMQHPGRPCLFHRGHTYGHFSFGLSEELDMKEGVSRKFVSLAPETYVILREGVCPTQINFLKKCVY